MKNLLLKTSLLLLLTLITLSCSKDEDTPIVTTDLSITMSANTNTPVAGNDVTFTLTATNNGPNNAAEVFVTDNILSGYTFVNADTSTGTYDETKGIWTIGNLDNEVATTLDITATVNVTGDYNNMVTITGQQTDTTLDNNSTSLSLTAIDNTQYFTYQVTTTGTGATVIITGLSQLWEDSTSANKYELVIPNEFLGHPVTAIGEDAFRSKRDITSVIIPDGVTFIGDLAFFSCTSLTSIIIPDGVISIGNSAFTECRALISATLPNSITTLGWRAFGNCGSLTTINIPNTLVTIQGHTFIDCTNLTNITIPDTVVSIGDYAFYRTGLSTVSISSNVTSIGQLAFNGCQSLTSITVDASNPNYSSPSSVLYDKNVSNLFAYPSGLVGSFLVSNTVTTIHIGAFLNSVNLNDITIPTSVTTIGRTVFSGCTGLTSIDLSTSLDTMGVAVFVNCSGLTSVALPNTLTTISEFMFRNCDGLTNISIPSSVSTIDAHAFMDCNNLSNVVMNPTAPPTISDSNLPFDSCPMLTAVDAIKVPVGTLIAYETTTGWSNYAAIIGEQ